MPCTLPAQALSLPHVRHRPESSLRLFLSGTAVGFALSALFVSILWLTDVMDVATHGANSKDAFLLLFILWIFKGLLFGCVLISYVVWQMGRTDG